MKLWNYCILSVILTIFLFMSGNPAVENISNTIGLNMTTTNGIANAPYFDGSKLMIAVLTFLATATATGIAIGFITKNTSEKYVAIIFITGSVIMFGSVIWGILTSAASTGWVQWVILTVFGAYGVGFLLAIFEWFAGGGD